MPTKFIVTDQEPRGANHDSSRSSNTEVKLGKSRYNDKQVEFFRSASKEMNLSSFMNKFKEKFPDGACRTKSALKQIFYQYRNTASSDPSVSSIARPCPERAGCDESFDDGTKDAIQGLGTPCP